VERALRLDLGVEVVGEDGESEGGADDGGGVDGVDSAGGADGADGVDGTGGVDGGGPGLRKPLGVTRYVTSERAGTSAVNAPPTTGIPDCVVAVLDALVRWGVAVPLPIPVFRREYETESVPRDALSATTATVPSVFAKAVRSRSASALVTPIRVAPGWT
jgi:hypothetical protein